MSSDLPRQGLLDTSILILGRWIDPAELPDEMAISAAAGRASGGSAVGRTPPGVRAG